MMTDKREPILEVTGLTKQTPAGLALNDVSFTLEKGRRLAIAGETGAGKSTLLKMIGGIIQPTAGMATFEGKRLKGPDDQLIPGNKGVAYLSQQYELRNNYRVWELFEIASKIDVAAADEIYWLCRVDHLIHRKTSDLSGGEKQRISLAMLLIAQPRLLVLDEPFSNLDPIHKRLLKTVLDDIAERLQLTCMLASHEPQDTLAWADEIMVLKDGRLVQQGAPEELYRRPLDEYVAGLLGPYQLLSATEAALLGLDECALPEGKKLLLRPEHIVLVSADERALSCTVTDVRFMGGHYELTVAFQGLTMRTHTTDRSFVIGDAVQVMYQPGSSWCV